MDHFWCIRFYVVYKTATGHRQFLDRLSCLSTVGIREREEQNSYLFQIRLDFKTDKKSLKAHNRLTVWLFWKMRYLAGSSNSEVNRTAEKAKIDFQHFANRLITLKWIQMKTTSCFVCELTFSRMNYLRFKEITPLQNNKTHLIVRLHS